MIGKCLSFSRRKDRFSRSIGQARFKRPCVGLAGMKERGSKAGTEVEIVAIGSHGRFLRRGIIFSELYLRYFFFSW